MSCETVLKELIQETDDISYLDRVTKQAEEAKELERLIRRARRTGSYTVPSKRISQYIDEVKGLVGQSIMLESTNDYKAHFVPVKSTFMVSPGVVSINDGEYIVDLDQGVTTNGLHYVQIDTDTMGSAETRRITAPLLTEVSGTVVQSLDEIVARVVAEDGQNLPEDYKGYLSNIFATYKNILMESGKDVKIDVEFFKALDANEKAYGDANPKNGKIRLLFGDTKYRTNTEILAEELQHVLVKAAMEKHPELRYEVEQLRDALVVEFETKYKGDGYKLFLEGINSPTELEIEEAKERWDYSFKNTEWPADEFLAHATTNQTIVRALLGVTTATKLELISKIAEVDDNGKKRVWAKIWNQIVDLINGIYSASKLNNKSAQEYAVSLLDKLLEVEYRVRKEKDKSRYEKLLDTISRTDRRIAGITAQIDNEYKNYQDMIDNSKKGKIKKIVSSIWKIRGLARARSIVLQNNIFSSLNKNMKNTDVAKFYEMFKQSKEFVEKEVVAVQRRTAKLLGDTYGLGKLDMRSRGAAKRVLLDADAQLLGTSAEIMTYLEDENKIEIELQEAVQGLSNSVLVEIENTAELLVTNRSNSVNVYTNAHQIAFDKIAKTTPEIIAAIDKAITLRAMQKLDAETKKQALEALKQNESGFDAAMELVRTEQAEMLDKAYRNNKMHVTKGAKQEHFKKEKKRYLVDEDEMKALSKAKIHNLGKEEELSKLLGKDVYIMMGDSLDTRYSEGLLKVVQLSNEGDSLKYTMMKLGDITEEEAEVRLELLRKHEGKLRTTLVPERTGMGQIYDYRIRIPYKDKVKYMTMEDDIITTVASTVSNITHKQEAMLSNHASLSYLRRFHEMYAGSEEFKFVEIGPKSEGKFKEYWDMLPHYIKSEVNNSKSPLMVTESMLIDYFGYHDASIINLPWIKSNKKRQLIAKKFEQIAMEMIRHWKLYIVAFTGSTVIGNNISNMMIALQHTSYKNPITYMNKYRKIWGMMNDYQKLRTRRIDLDLQRKTGKTGLDREIKALDAKMAANPVHEIIEDGQYSVIFEDLNTSYFDNEGIIEGKINEVISKAEGKKGKNMLKTLVDTLYLRKDNALHDSIMKATLYSDAINKVIILMDAKEQAQKLHKEGKSNKVIGEYLFEATEKEIEKFLKGERTPQSWLNAMDGLHVNYGYLDNKYIKYANDVGALVFTKYFFRILPAMARMVATKGLTVALTETAQAMTHIDVETPIDQYFNPINSIMNKTSLYTRPGNLFGTLFEGPVVSLAL